MVNTFGEGDHMNQVQVAGQNVDQESARKEQHEFVVKAFVQTPEAEIKLDGRRPQGVRWLSRWDRKCGNPATSIIASR